MPTVFYTPIALRLRGLAFPLLLFLLAFLPRLAALGRYVTPDELTWVYRSIHFREAILAGDWANTIQAGHPGVITTWLGAIGIQLELWLRPSAAADLDWLLKLYWLSPDNGEAFRHLAVFLTAGRLGVAAVTSLGVVAAYLLARSRLGVMPAVLGGLLLALDPFAAGLSGLLHVDALLATFCLITLLLVLPPANPKSQIPSISQAKIPNPKHIPSENPKSQIPNPKLPVASYILAGVTTALAVLSKSPGLLLFLFVPAILLWPLIGSLAAKITNRSQSVLFRLSAADVAPFVYWLIPCLLTILLLLPAVWADPGYVAERIGGLAERKVVGQNLRPDFFLGEAVFRPGLHFYPLALLFRLSPAVLLGLLLLLLLFVGRLGKSPYRWPPAVPWLLLFSLAFLVFLNLSQRKFDRYLLPAVLPLILVTAYPFSALSLLRSPVSSDAGRVVSEDATSSRRGLAWAGLITPLLLQLAFLLICWPYPLTAYNWLAGGTAVAQHVLPMGWGEDTGAAARWLADTSTAGLETGPPPLFTSNVPAAAPFYPGPVYPLTKSNLARAANGPYYVALVTQDWQPDPAVAASEPPPIHQIGFNGLERARLYTAVPPVLAMDTLPLIAAPHFYRFNEGLQMSETAVVPAVWPDRLPVLINWQALRPADYQLRFELRDETGHAWESSELPLLNDDDQAAGYWPASANQTAFYEQAIPPDLPPGGYTLVVMAFDEQGAQMGVFDEDGRFAGTAAPIASLDLAAPAEQPALSIPVSWSNGRDLAGYGPLPEQAGTGEQLVLDLWWRAPAGDEPAALALDLGTTRLTTPLPVNGWRPGQIYHIRPTWTIPADLVAGAYDLALQPLAASGEPLWPQPIILGQLQVEARDRLFELPAGQPPLNIQLGSVARLQAATAEETAEGVLVHLVWQAQQPDGRSYTTFVHLRDAAGQIIAQIDRPPAEPSDGWLPNQVILDDFLLRPPALEADAVYTVAVGLYDPASGRRLPVYTAAGDPLPDDQYIIDRVTR